MGKGKAVAVLAAVLVLSVGACSPAGREDDVTVQATIIPVQPPDATGTTERREVRAAPTTSTPAVASAPPRSTTTTSRSTRRTTSTTASSSATPSSTDPPAPSTTTTAPPPSTTTPPTTAPPTTGPTLPSFAPPPACHPDYSGCLNPSSPDYDCVGGGGNGPDYTGTVDVYGADPFGLDDDGDGVGCEAA